MLRKLAQQSSWYLIVHVLGSILTLIRVPIWTRYFTLEEYGWFSLITATLSFVGPFTRLGLPRSVLRFYSEFKSGKTGLPLSCFYTTFFFGTVGVGVFAGILFLIIILLLGPEHTGGQYLYELYKLSGVLIIIGAAPAMFFAFLRVEQKAKLYAWLGFGKQFLGFTLNLILMFVFFYRLQGLYVAAIYFQIIIVILVLVTLLRQKKIILSTFSKDVFIDGLRYGLPLVPAALANVLSGVGDRYVLQYFMGPEAVALYSAGYGVTTQIKAILTVMMFAVTPMYLAIWEEKGRKKTEEFLSSVLDYYLLAAIPAIFLFSIYGGDLLVILASTKYAEARVIMPYLAAPLFLHGGITIYTAGLYIEKKTKYILFFTLGAGILNVILNIIMVPFMGLAGAALATLISYIFLISFANVLSAKFLTIQLNYKSLIKYTLLSIAVVVMLHFVKIDLGWGVLVKICIGVFTYATAILALDNRLRSKIRIALKFQE